jgi:hypothetical protein
MIKLILSNLIDLGTITAVNVKDFPPYIMAISHEYALQRVDIEEFVRDERAFITNIQKLEELGEQITTTPPLLIPMDHQQIFGNLSAVLELHMDALEVIEMNAVSTDFANQRWHDIFRKWQGGAIRDKYITFLALQEINQMILQTALKKHQQYEGDRASSLLIPILKLITSPAERLAQYERFIKVNLN